MHALKDENAETRRYAIVALGKIGEPAEEIVYDLILALKDEDAEVREHAARTLGKIGEPSKPAILPLIEALNDEEGSVRGNAAFALKAIGTPKAMNAVEEFREKEAINTIEESKGTNQ